MFEQLEWYAHMDIYISSFFLHTVLWNRTEEPLSGRIQTLFQAKEAGALPSSLRPMPALATQGLLFQIMTYHVHTLQSGMKNNTDLHSPT